MTIAKIYIRYSIETSNVEYKALQEIKGNEKLYFIYFYTCLLFFLTIGNQIYWGASLIVFFMPVLIEFTFRAVCLF